MKNMKMFKRALIVATSLLMANPSFGLNILLTNDDSWNTANILVLKDRLVKAGHDVLLASPCIGQSGKGGALSMLKPVPVDKSRATKNEYCLGDTDVTKAYNQFENGTPVIAALYGIDVLAPQRWQARPDLVISGPNEGHNLGVLNNNSGTLGAAMMAIGKGIPTIAVSAHHNSEVDHKQAPKIAAIVVEIVSKLQRGVKPGQALLPEFTGLNINLPEDLENHKGYRFTDVGWSSGMEILYSEDMSKEMLAEGMVELGEVASLELGMAELELHYKGVGGVVFKEGNLGDNNPNAEGNAIMQGYITISTIDASVQASKAKRALVKNRLSSLN